MQLTFVLYWWKPGEVKEHVGKGQLILKYCNPAHYYAGEQIVFLMILFVKLSFLFCVIQWLYTTALTCAS